MHTNIFFLPINSTIDVSVIKKKYKIDVEIWIFDQIDMIGKFFDAILVLGKLRDCLELFIF
jgi:hypothetical protein